MESILEELNQVPGIKGSMIIGRDGLVIVPFWDHEIDMDMLGAHSADVFGAAESLMDEKFQFGIIDLLTLETDSAKFFFQTIDESTFLAVAANAQVNLGLIRNEIKAAAEKIKKVL